MQERLEGGQMTIGDCLYIVIPAYNEEDNLSELIEAWYPILALTGPKSCMLILNDGSTDRSAALLEELGRNRPQLLVLNETNKGHGPSLIHAYRYAVEAGADYVFQTDSDNQTKAEDFPDLWLRRGAYPVCVGYRREREDGKSRVLVSQVLTLVLSLFFGVWVKDANVPFRLYRREVLEALLPLIPADFKLVNALFMAETRRLKLKHYYHDIKFLARAKGENSIHLKKIVTIGWQALLSFLKVSRKFFQSKAQIRAKLEKEGCQFA